jgi:hypothetical protein
VINMRSFISGILVVGAVLLAGLARGQETQWHTGGPAGRPIASTAWNAAGPNTAAPAASAAPAPIVTLSRPVPIRSSKPADVAVKPASFEASPITRTVVDEVRPTDPLPLGPPPMLIQQAPGTEEIPVKPRTVSNTPSVTSSLFAPALVDGDCGVACGTAGCCDPCACCPTPRGRVWASAEYLLWFVRSANVPPLLTTSPTGTPLGTAGILGQPTTTVLFNNNNLAGDLRNGGRFTLGFWIPGCDGFGLEASYFFLGQINSNFSAASNGSPILMRPFTESPAGVPLAIPTAFPGVVAGTFNVNSNSYLWGAEFNVRRKLWCGCCGYVDLLGGYRFFQLQDGLNISDVETPLIGPPGQPSFLVNDSFFTRNTFNGGQLGIDAQWNFWRHWFFGATTKVAIGDIHQTISINGSTSGAANLPFGVLALPSNIGTFSRDRFGVLPSGTFKVGYYFTPRWRVWVGYDFMYLSSVVRASEQIDLTLNHNLLPGGTGVGPARPAVPFNTQGFWAQGVTFGLEYRW